MTRRITIINLIELFVLVVFSELSVAMPPMLGCGSSSQPLRSDAYNISQFSIQSQSTEPTRYESVKLNYSYYYDDSKFDYSLVTSNGEKMLQNKGKNTEIVFLFDTKMQIYVKGNENVLYTLEFVQPSQASLFACRIITATPSRYKKCSGSNAYKIEKLHDSTCKSFEPFDLSDVTEDWCIFKERKGNVTTFTIKRMKATIRYQGLKGVFRPNDYELKGVPGVDNKLELSILFNRVPLGPKYILETSTPEKLEEFLK